MGVNASAWLPTVICQLLHMAYCRQKYGRLNDIFVMRSIDLFTACLGRWPARYSVN